MGISWEIGNISDIGIREKIREYWETKELSKYEEHEKYKKNRQDRVNRN